MYQTKILQEVLKISIHKIGLKIAFLNLLPRLPRDNVLLTHC